LKKLLFTGGGGAGSEAIYRLLYNRYEVHFADADVETISKSIPEEARHQILYAGDLQFVPHLGALCEEKKIDLVIPSVDEELLKLTKLNIPVMLPEYEYIKTMLDKLDSMEAISTAGIDSPKTITVSNFLNGSSFSFPCIVKPRNGRGSRNVSVLTKFEQVSAYLTLTGISSDDVVLQELFAGQEYTVLMSADAEKNLKEIVPVEVEIKRGITLRAEVVYNQEVVKECKKIHSAIPAGGCYNIQLILTDDNRVVPFEINPRISTTFCMGLAYGIDPIAIFSGKENFSLSRIGNKLQRFWVNSFSC